MARRVNPAEGRTETAEHDDRPSMEGGAAGIPAAAINNAAAPPGGMVAGNASRASDPDATPPPPVKRYVVEGAGPTGKRLLLNGYPALLRDGKVVDDCSYDIGMLRQQGLRLRPIEG